MEKLINKAYRSYDYISRYAAFPYYFNTGDDKYIYGTTAQLNQDNVGYSLHTVKRGDTFDSIALDYYNSPTLYWVICDFNKIQDPFLKLKEGQKLKIPVLSVVSFKTDH